MEIQRTQESSRSEKPLLLEKAKDKALDLFYSQEQLLTHYGASLTIGDTLTSPSIRNLVKTHGNDYMVVFVTGLLNEFLSFVPNGLSGSEVLLYADKILAHCPTWTTADLVLCLKNGADGKYGPVKFRWTWNSDFVEWARKYEQQKADFFHDRHVKKTNEAKMANQDLVRLLPKELIDKFAKEKFADQEKRKMLDIKIPDKVVAQGLGAVDKWIEENMPTKLKK